MFDFDLFRSAAEVYEGVNDTVLAQDAAEIVTAETIMESPVIQDYLDGSLTGNTAAKKLLAAAMIIANDKGYISLPEKYANPQSIGAIADTAVETIKIAYDVATGKMSVDDAIDYGVKIAAAKAKTAVDYLIDKGTPIVADWVMDKIESVFPPAKVLRPKVLKVAQVVAPKVKKLAHKGIDYLADRAKEYLKEKVKPLERVGAVVGAAIKSIGGSK